MADVRGGDETILLVEDELALRRLIRQRLEILGYTVLRARNGKEALTVARTHTGAIHLLLSDVVMPEMDGFELAEQLSEVRPDTKVLFITGEVDRSVAVRGGLKESGRSFIVKPFTAQALEQGIRAVLDRDE